MVDPARVGVLVVDDEPVARAGLRRMLAAIEWLECVGEAASGPAAVEAIDALRPELVLLDIEMPGFPGTEVLRRAKHRPRVVFTTAYSQHAVTAFELGALDYVMKPFGEERLRAALDRVRAAMGEPAAAHDRFAEALGRGPMSRLFVRSGRSIVPVAVSQVAWFESQGDYVAAHVPPAQHLLHVALNHLEERLDAQRFVRIHRTCIVNLDHVAAFRRGPEGRLYAEMKEGGRLDVSRARARELRALAR
ncbi:MAG TPA: LytTR family DNA-binding domain-containing protein [Usitatibacter sp.]|nr:LytTR family DNA-binding domain-containing protein [Usitatibacter sp.]